MTAWSFAITWRQIRNCFLALSGSLIPLPTFAASPSSIGSPPEPVTFRQQVAAYQTPTVMPSPRSLQFPAERSIQGRLVEARHTLIELQTFVEEASQVMRLGGQLESRRLHNDRLRRSLINTRTARDAFENHMRPSETMVTALTRTIVRNWLETVRLRHLSDEAGRALVSSETSWFALERRVDALKEDVAARRNQIRLLRAERAALNVELGRLRQEINRTKANTQQFIRDRERITNATDVLNRRVASDLRRILLESDDGPR